MATVSNDPWADAVAAWTVQSDEPIVLPEQVPGNVVTAAELPDLEALKADPYVDVDQHLTHVVVAADENERVAIRTGRSHPDEDAKIAAADEATDHEGEAGEISPEASEAAPDAPANNPSTDEAPASE